MMHDTYLHKLLTGTAGICAIVIPNSINRFNFIWPGFAPAEYPVCQQILLAAV